MIKKRIYGYCLAAFVLPNHVVFGQSWNQCATGGGTNTCVTNASVGIGTTMPAGQLQISGGQTLVDAGSSSAPPIAFTGETSTGLFKPASGTIGFSFSGNTGATMASWGLAAAGFGIYGVTSAHAGGFNASGTGVFSWAPSNTVDTGVSRVSPTTVAIGNGSAGDASGTLLTGRLGIGTTASPASQLTVLGGNAQIGSENDSAVRNLYFGTKTNQTNGIYWLSAGDSAVAGATITYARQLNWGGNLNFLTYRGAGGATGGPIIMGEVDSPAGYPTVNQHLTVNAPSLQTDAVLHVNASGNQNAANFVGGNSGFGGHLVINDLTQQGNTDWDDSANPLNVGLGFRNHANNSLGALINANPAATGNYGAVLQFNVKNAGGGAFPSTPAMIVQAGGNVGIGTTNPPYQLSVKTTIGAGEVIVTNTSNWSDYVFDTNYRLVPLAEVADYVRENHHLPDIPSAAEVKDKGISLGDMQAKLLAKIEELTLHAIEMEKRMSRMEEENRRLRKENGRTK